MLGYKLDYIWNHVTDTPNDRKTKNNPTFLLKMFKTFSTVFKLMLVSMFSCYFGHGDSSMYRYRNVQQSRPYTVVSCSLTHLSSLSQCAAVAGDPSQWPSFSIQTLDQMGIFVVGTVFLWTVMLRRSSVPYRVLLLVR